MISKYIIKLAQGIDDPPQDLFDTSQLQPATIKLDFDRPQREVLRHTFPQLRTAVTKQLTPTSMDELFPSTQPGAAPPRRGLTTDDWITYGGRLASNFGPDSTPQPIMPVDATFDALEQAITSGESFTLPDDAEFGRLFVLDQLHHELSNPEPHLQDLNILQKPVAQAAINRFRHQIGILRDRAYFTEMPNEFIHDLYDRVGKYGYSPEALETMLTQEYNAGKDMTQYADQIKDLSLFKLIQTARTTPPQDRKPIYRGIKNILRHDADGAIPDDILPEEMQAVLAQTLKHTGTPPTPSVMAQTMSFFASPDVPSWQKIAAVAGVGMGLAGLFSMLFGENMFVSFGLMLLGFGATAAVATGHATPIYEALTRGLQPAPAAVE